MRRVIGKAKGKSERMLGLLDAWVRSGSNRLDANGDNVYDHSAAVSLMDSWWTRFVRAEFQPALGRQLFDTVESRVLSLGNVDQDFGWGWASQVQKDLRSVLGRHERGRYSRVYCGGPLSEPARPTRLQLARARCRGLLISTLRAAVAELEKSRGAATSKWTVPATCSQTSPPSCDQQVPSTAGAVDTPPFPWQNRGTFHQIDEIAGHR